MKYILPLHIKRPNGKKKYALNMNSYRNNHYQTNNYLKKAIKEIVKEQTEEFYKLSTPISVNYVLYLGNNRKSDVSNWCSVLDKFFLDALVELGFLEDDNYLFVDEISFIFGGIEKGHERLEVTVVES